MKILAISDRPSKEKIKIILEQNPDIEVICTLGDLDYFSLIELADINNVLKLGVYGNHCSGNYFDQLGIKNMHLTTIEHEGLVFGGFEGCVKYKDSNYSKMYTQEEATKLMEKFPKVDVMLAHCPPYGINDEPNELAHQGFVALKEYIEKQEPKYFLHGHTYPEEGKIVTQHKNTKIIYVYSSKIIEI